jgi:hypothetical protein
MRPPPPPEARTFKMAYRCSCPLLLGAHLAPLTSPCMPCSNELSVTMHAIFCTAQLAGVVKKFKPELSPETSRE